MSKTLNSQQIFTCHLLTVTITDEPVAGGAGGINILTVSVPLVVVIVVMICVFAVIVVCFIAYQRRTKKIT